VTIAILVASCVGAAAAAAAVILPLWQQRSG